MSIQKTVIGQNEIARLLEWIDSLLEPALEAMIASNGTDSISDPYRGLYISETDVRRLFFAPRTPPTIPVEMPIEKLSAALAGDSRLALLQERCGLSDFDLGLIIIALANELELRYERIYAFLQDDVTRKLPTVDLALGLLCRTPEDRLRHRARLGPHAPLIRHRIVQLVADSAQVPSPLLRQSLKLDDHIVSFLLGNSGLDPRLDPFCSLVRVDTEKTRTDVHPDIIDADAWRYVVQRVAEARQSGESGVLIFSGPALEDKRQAAERLAASQHQSLITVDLSRIPAWFEYPEDALDLLFREVTLHQAMLVVYGYAAQPESSESAPTRRVPVEAFTSALSRRLPGLTIFCADGPLPDPSPEPEIRIELHFPLPAFSRRRSELHDELQRSGVRISRTEIEDFAGRFVLTSSEIIRVVRDAVARHEMRHSLTKSDNGHQPGRIELSCADLAASARMLSQINLGVAVNRIEPVFSWADIVLPRSTRVQLEEICQRVKSRQLVMEAWGFERKLSTGKGAPVLFAGPPGTGKTMAAEVIATDLGMNLFKVDLSGVISKYIGETEKNLDRIFEAAERSNGVLFFDEADALFGKRSEVRDSHDRYANIEISFLLQKMEEYDGLSILATNLRRNMDDAFVRRLAYAISFPLPGEADRLRIWNAIWPRTTPRSTELDLEYMARQFKLAGGNIKNISLNAAFYAAAEDQPVAMRHLILATTREYQKMSKIVAAADFAEYGHLTADMVKVG